MALGQRWLRQPQSVWLRKALFQIHLWTGIGVGLYVFAICVSGSAVVFNVEVSRAFREEPVTVAVSGERLNEEQLKEAVSRGYPNPDSIQIWEVKSETDAVEIWIGHGDDITQRIFDPYTGADLGHPLPMPLRISMWLVDFHDNLRYADVGRKVNGVGAAFLVVLCITGLIIWWPGIKGWQRSLVIEPKSNWKRLNWTMHSAIGFWSLALVFMWAVSGVYLAFPAPFADAVDFLQPPEDYAEQSADVTRSGDQLLQLMTRLHFGRNYGHSIKILWVVLGLTPPVLFVTGAIMWWNRVLSPAARELAAQQAIKLPGSRPLRP